MALARLELMVSEVEWLVDRLEAGPTLEGEERRTLRRLRSCRDKAREQEEREREHMRKVKADLEASYQQRFGQQA